MTRHIPFIAAFASALFATVVYANSTAQDFVTKASIANQFEIDTSKLALDRSQNSNIKSFAQRMVDDHTQTGEKLEEVLSNSNSGAEPASDLDTKHQKMLDTLEASSDDVFDRQYISIQTKAHEEAVSLFSDYAKHGQDKALKNFANETLPALREHLKHVRSLKSNQ